MAFDLDAARKAGYSDDQIADGLAKLSGVDIDAARKAGYSSTVMLPGLVKAAETDNSKTSVWEDVKTGVAGIGNTVDRAATLAASNFVPEDNKGAMFEASQQREAERNQWSNPDNKTQGFGGKAISAVSTLPMQLATAPLNAIDTAVKFVNNGESLGKAYEAAGIDAAFTAAGFAIPVAFGRTLLQKALTGGASNAIQYGLSKGIISQVADKPQTQKEFTPTAEDAGVAAIVGAGFGVHHALDNTPAQQAARAIDSVDISNPNKFGPDWTPEAQAVDRLNPNRGDTTLISPAETVKQSSEPITPAAPVQPTPAPSKPDVAAQLQAIRPFEESSLAKGAVSADLEKVQTAETVDDAITAASDIANGTSAETATATAREARRQLIQTPVSKRDLPAEEAKNAEQPTDTNGLPLRDDIAASSPVPEIQPSVHEAGSPENVQPTETGPSHPVEVPKAEGDSIPDASPRVDEQPALKAPEPEGKTASIEQEVGKAKMALDEAGVSGKDRTDTVAAVRRGDLTVQDVVEAYPNKTSGGTPLEKAQAKLAEGMNAINETKKQETANDVSESAKISKETPTPNGEKTALENTQEFQGLIKRGYSANEAHEALTQTIEAKPVADEATPTKEAASRPELQNNGSGESSASMEAVNRLAAEKAAGQDRVKLDTRTGEVTPLVTADRVDAKAGANEVILQRGIGKKEWTVLDQGNAVRDPTGAIARATSEGKLQSSASKGQEENPPTIVEIKDNYGRTRRVYQSDLAGNSDRLPTIRKNGDVVSGEEIPRAIIKKEIPVAPRVVSEEGYLAQNGASRQDIGDAGLHRGSGNVSERAKQTALDRQAEKDAALVQRRAELRTEYQDKIAKGELRSPTTLERLKETAAGMPENEATQAAQRLLEKKGLAVKEKQNETTPSEKASVPVEAPTPAKELARYTSRQVKADGTPKEGNGMTELNARQYSRELNAKTPEIAHTPEERPDGMFDVVGKEKPDITLMHAGLSPVEALNKIKETEFAKSATAKLGAMLEAPKAAMSDLRLMTVPMAEGSSAARAAAKDYANNERKAQWQWNQFDKLIVKNFDDKQLRRMWDAADEENDLRREGITSATEGLNKLAPDERAVVETLHTYGEELLARAQANGMLESTGVHYWAPRMVAMIGENGEITKPQSRGAGDLSSSGDGRNISTYASSAQHRKYDTSAETEAAAQGLAKEEGQTAVVVRNIRTMPMAMAKFERAIAARDLINQVKAIGAATGRETVLQGAAEKGDKDYFTLDHPAFKTWQPLFRDGAIVKDEQGDAVLTKVPLRISKEFEGPLKAVMSTTPSKAYLGAMAIKSKSMGLIMYSPIIHNAVEWGRAFPAMDLKGKASLGVYTYLTGNAAKNNPAIMSEAIEHGLVPIGGRGQHMDITSMMGDPTMEVGKSWTAKAIGAAVGLISEKNATTAMKAVDAAGKFWHETLLWDRVADLQMGLYTSMKGSLINKGLPETDAAYVAAHFANRYAGALPRESMSSGATQLLNLSLFSRSFTMGNLGAMKDMITGLPKDVQSQIKQGGSELAMQAARSQARRIAIGTFVMDVGLMYTGNSLLQDWFEREKTNGWKGWLQSYEDRTGALWDKLKTDPASVLAHPFNSLEGLTSTGQNEPGKEQRVKWGEDKTGTEIYLRLPTGKIGEEFKNYADMPSGAIKQMRNKESQFVRPIDQLVTNDMGAGQKLYDTSKDASTMKNVGAVVMNFMKAQVPTDQIVAAYDLARGKGDDMDVKKIVGPLVGATFSKGAPGGPAVGELYAEQREHQDKVISVMPDVHRALKYGNEDEAIKIMESVQMTPKEIGTTLKHIEQPESRLSRGAVKNFGKHATDAQKEKLNSLQK